MRPPSCLVMFRSTLYILGRTLPPSFFDSRLFLPSPAATLLLHLRDPQPTPSRACQEKEECQQRDQLQDHSDSAKPDKSPCVFLVLRLSLPPVQPPQLVPPVEAELAESRPGDDDVGGRTDDRNQVERQVYDELEDLDEGPWGVFSAGGWLAEHLDGIGCVWEEQTLWGHEVGEAFVDQSSLREEPDQPILRA